MGMASLLIDTPLSLSIMDAQNLRLQQSGCQSNSPAKARLV